MQGFRVVRHSVGFLVIAVGILSSQSQAQTRLFELTGNGGEFGQGASGVGDVDQDGFDDILVGDNVSSADRPSSPGYARVLSGRTGEVIFEVNGIANDDKFGWSVDGAGDVNGDGFPDFIVGAPRRFNSQLPGYAQVFSGRDGSLLYTFNGLVADDKFGLEVAGAGDVNADGFDDVIIGASFTQNGDAFVFSGADGALLYALSGEAAGDFFGFTVSGAKDINQDGFDDFIIGADANNLGTGAAYVYSGATGQVLYTLRGTAGESFGRAVSDAGDVNADGIPDVVVTSLRSQKATVFSGANGSPIWEVSEGGAQGYFGFTVSGAQDINQDGFDDILVGDIQDGGEAGAIWLFSGVDGSVLFRDAGGPGSTNLGSAVAELGDINNDNVPDFVAGAHGFAGAARVYSGRACSASVSSYGSGWPGTNGIPGFAWFGRPIIGELFTLSVSNSSGVDAAGILILGLQPASIGTPLGGTLLVIPLSFRPLVIPGSGLGIGFDIPVLSDLCGFEVYLQSLQLDPGASQGVAFSGGLVLSLGGS